MGLFSFLRRPASKARPSKGTSAKSVVNNDNVTLGYRPSRPLTLFWGYGNALPPLYKFYFDLEVMLTHPQVRIALDYYKSGLASAEFDIKAKRPEVKKFVHEQYQRLWAQALGQVQEAYEYGYIGCEIVYRFNDDGQLSFDCLKSFHPRDVRVLTQDSKYFGVRVYNIQRGDSRTHIDLWGPEAGLAKGFWFAHRARHGSMWGWSQLLAAWRPWRMLAAQDGGEDVAEMAVYRFGVQGPVVYYPPASQNVEVENADPNNPSNREQAIDSGERYKAGATSAIPSTFDEKGNPLWKLDVPENVINVAPLIEYNDSLKRDISLGIGVPPELLEAAETGSGYSGRQIPLEAFFEGQMVNGRDIARAFREQIVEPLVRWNFGDDAVEFDVDLMPLLQTRAKRQLVQANAENSDPLNALTGFADGVQHPSGSPFQLSTLGNDHKFSSTQVNLPYDLAAMVKGCSFDIPQSELADKGREDNPHITIKYGLHTENPDDVQKAVVGFGSIMVTLLPVSIFETEDADVVKCDVFSPELHKLNRLICDKLAHTDTHPKYVPHVTIAYVKRGEGFKYVGDTLLSGLRFRFDRFVFSNRAGMKVEILLAGEGPVTLDTWDESKHPRDEQGEWTPADMTSGEWEGHLRATGERGHYGPGLGGVKLAHRTHVLDALTSGRDIPDHVRAEYPELDARFPAPKSRANYRRRGLNAAKASQREDWAREGMEHGIAPKHVHDAAREIMQRNREMVDEHNAMLKRARESLDKYTKRHRTMYAAAVRGGKGQVEDDLPGLDVVARSMAGEFPGMFGNAYGYEGAAHYDSSQDDAGAKLMEYLHAGNLRPLDEQEAYSQALSMLMDHKTAGLLGDDIGEDEPRKLPRWMRRGGDANDDFEFGALRAKQPHEMSRSEFVADHRAKIGKLERSHYRSGFRKGSFVDPINTRKARSELAAQAGLMPNTPQHGEAVKSWPLHKLHVAAAIARGDEVPAEVAGQYPELAKKQPVTMSTIPADSDPLHDPIAEQAIASAANALRPLRAKLFRDLLAILTEKGPADWWQNSVIAINAFRDDTAQALTIARVAVALAAMRRAVASDTSRFPPGLSAPPAPSSSESAANDWVLPHAFGVPPKTEPVAPISGISESVTDLRSRQLLTRDAFDRLVGKAKDEAFTVAGIDSEEQIGTIRDLVARATERGEDLRKWRRQAVQTLDGESPFLSDAHAENVFRTNIQSAYSAGQDAIMAHPLVGDYFPYVRYVAIHDSPRVRPWHLALESCGIDGTAIYWANDPIWDIIKPPCDYQCRCGRIFLTVAQAARAGLAEAIEWQRTGIEPVHGRGRLPANWQQSESFKREYATAV